MRKLKLPELVVNDDLPDKMSKKEFEKMMEERHFEFVPTFNIDIDKLEVITSTDFDDNGEYMYSYIADTESGYWDDRIVATDDFHFRTYFQWKKAVKAMAAQLVKRWKEWVRGLYVEE